MLHWPYYSCCTMLVILLSLPLLVASGDSYGVGTSIGVGILASVNNIANSVAASVCSAAMVSWITAVFVEYNAATWAGCALSSALAMAVSAANQVLSDYSDGTITSRAIYTIEGIGQVSSTAKIAELNVTLYEVVSHVNETLTWVPLQGYEEGIRAMALIHESNDPLLGNVEKKANREVKHAHMYMGRHEDGYSTMFIGGSDYADLSTLIQGYNKTGKHVKRGSYDVTWASYSFNDGQLGDSIFLHTEKWAAADVARDDTAAGAWFDQHMGQKVCIAGYAATAGGPELTVDEAERKFSTKGEIYWNAYGGIDGFCDSADDDMGY